MKNPHLTRRRLLFAAAAGAAAATRSSAAPAATYRNPIGVTIADPFVLREPNGTYFMYGTGHKGATAYPAFTSRDLVNWTALGHTYQRNPADSWCTDFF